MCCSPPTPMLLGCGQSCQGKLFGGALHPQPPPSAPQAALAAQPGAVPGWDLHRARTQRAAMGRGRGLRAPRHQCEGARAHTRDCSPHPKKARSGPSRHPPLTQAVPYQTRCLRVLPSPPWGPSILEGQTETGPPQPLHHPWGQLGLYKLEGVGVPTHRKQLRPSYLITQVLGPAGHRAGGAESFPPPPCLASTPRHAHVQCPRVSGSPPPPPHVRTPRRAPGARSVLGPAAGSTDGDSPRPGAA